jgi:hypothetical protein
MERRNDMADTHNGAAHQSRIAVITAQQAWARARGIALDKDGYCIHLDDNLFEPLSDQAEVEFGGADGDELGTRGQRGKLKAPHSSSALACNVFHHWRHQQVDRTPLQLALRATSQIEDISFERKFPTGVGPKSPNVDVVLRLAGGGLVAIESKFLEPLSPSSKKSLVQEKYFAGSAKGRWAELGLHGAQSLADAVRCGSFPFRHLDAAQLLKHILGLGRQSAPWTLIYMWFGLEARCSQQHGEELAAFTTMLGDDVARFRAVSYQELFAHLRPVLDADHVAYRDYLTTRYSL